MSKYIPYTDEEKAILILEGHCPDCFYPSGRGHYHDCKVKLREDLNILYKLLSQLQPTESKD